MSNSLIELYKIGNVVSGTDLMKDFDKFTIDCEHIRFGVGGYARGDIFINNWDEFHHSLDGSTPCIGGNNIPILEVVCFSDDLEIIFIQINKNNKETFQSLCEKIKSVEDLKVYISNLEFLTSHQTRTIRAS